MLLHKNNKMPIHDNKYMFMTHLCSHTAHTTRQQSYLLVCFHTFLTGFLGFAFAALNPAVFLVIWTLSWPEILSCLMKMWSHFPTHIHPLILSMLLSILSFPFESYSSFSLLQLCHLSMQRRGGVSSLCLALSLSVPFVFFCTPNKCGLGAFNEIYRDSPPQSTQTHSHNMSTSCPYLRPTTPHPSSHSQHERMHFNIPLILP